jgi:hypothetical protein
MLEIGPPKIEQGTERIKAQILELGYEQYFLDFHGLILHLNNGG